jgi:GTP-binding protein EngB required for normal cell division
MAQMDGILERIASLAKELKLANLEPQIAACRRQRNGRQGIDVAVFGRFKAGKSSFLNHLAGRDVLPIGVVPLTAVITRLRFGPAERAEVCYMDGHAEVIPVQDIGLFVGEKENHENRKQVTSVDVELPALEGLAPLQFVDTPGLGSVFRHNTDAAMKWLPNVGAALVAVSSDAPLSERDLALLEELRRHTPKIVLLLTKADLLTEAQRAEVLAFVQGQIRAKWDGGLPVFFYSVHPALAVLKGELVGRLLIPLGQECGDATGAILRHKLASLVSQTLEYLRVGLAAATQAEAARQALDGRLDEERRQFGLFREELQVMAREWSTKALDESLWRLQPTQRNLQAKVTAELGGQLDGWQLRLPPLLDVWREWLGVFLKRELSEVSHSQQTMFCSPVQRAHQYLTRTLRAFRDRLTGHVKAALGLRLTPREFALEVRQPSAPPVDVAFAFDVAFSMSGWLIPLTLFRRPIERVLLRKARWEVEKNLSRLAADWSGRVATSIGELTRQAEQQALDELAALEQTLARTKSDEPLLREAIGDLEAAGEVLRVDGLRAERESSTRAGGRL